MPDELDRSGDEKIAWTSWPWAEDSIGRKVMAVASVLVAAGVAAAALDSVGVGVVSIGFLFLCLSRYLLPSAYELSPDGVTVRHLGLKRFHPWGRFRRAALRRDGVFLGTFATPRRVDTWRGCFLRCPGKREAIHAYACAHIAVEPSPAGARARPGDARAAGAH